MFSPFTGAILGAGSDIARNQLALCKAPAIGRVTLVVLHLGISKTLAQSDHTMGDVLLEAAPLLAIAERLRPLRHQARLAGACRLDAGLLSGRLPPLLLGVPLCAFQLHLLRPTVAAFASSR